MSTKTESKERSRRITLKDIAERLDVSHATVSRALNHVSDPFISEATRTKVRLAARELGYRPNHAARSLATGRTGLISLWIWSEDVQTAYHGMVARTMYEEALRHSYQLIIDLVGRKSLTLASSPAFDPWHVDGIIAHEASPAIEAQLAGAVRPPVPLVATGAYHFLPGADCVSVDLGPGASQAMEHLLLAGRRSIAYVNDDRGEWKRDSRYQRYIERMADSGLPTMLIDVPAGRAAVRKTVRDRFQNSVVPDAFFCHNDDTALGVYRALCDLGIRVPGDAAIVGCDGIEDMEYLETPITTIVQPLEEMLSLAYQFLERRIEDPTHPIQEAHLVARLEIRESTGGKSILPT